MEQSMAPADMQLSLAPKNLAVLIPVIGDHWCADHVDGFQFFPSGMNCCWDSDGLNPF